MDQRERAYALCEAGDYPQAIQIWQKIIADAPSTQDLIEYSFLLHQLYLFKDAEGVYEQLYQNEEGTALQLIAIAKQLCARASYQKSIKFLKKACLMSPDNADYAVLLASSMERTGQLDEAKRLLQSILQQHPHLARAVRLSAHIDRRQNNMLQAQQSLENYLQHYESPDTWRVQYELASVLDRMGDYSNALDVLMQSKELISTQAREFHPIWRKAAARQWQTTQKIDRERLDLWNQGVEHLSPDFKLCLLAGFPRSGTTLLEQVINASSVCIGTDESGILASQFRDPIVLHANSAEDALAELDLFTTQELSAGRAEYLRCTEEYIGEKLNGRILIEKEPLLTTDLHVPLRLFPESKIIMPLRDPRDVVISFFFTIVPLSSGSVASISLEDSCRYYAEVMRHWLHFRKILPQERWLESRYEDLLADPEAQTKRLAGFLDIEWSTAMLKHHENKTNRAVSTPTYDDVSRPLYQRSIARWKHYEQDLAPHLHHLQPYIEAFGYDTTH